MKKKVNPETYKEELKDAKRIYTLKKARSPHRIEYIEDPEDDWFVYVVKIANKSGKWESFSMIIQKDVDQWVGMDIRAGWEVLSAV